MIPIPQIFFHLHQPVYWVFIDPMLAWISSIGTSLVQMEYDMTHFSFPKAFPRQCAAEIEWTHWALSIKVGYKTSQIGIWYNGNQWDIIGEMWLMGYIISPTTLECVWKWGIGKNPSFWQLSWTIGFGIPDFQTNSAISLNPCDSFCVLRLPQVPQIFRPSWHPVLGSEPRKVAHGTTLKPMTDYDR